MRKLAVVPMMALFAVMAACGSDGEASSPTNTPASNPTSAAPSSTSTPSTAGSTSGGVEDDVFVIGEGSVATFTVREQLSNLPAPNDAVLETDAITGTVLLSGEPFEITIDLHELESDQDRRDSYVRRNLFPIQRNATISFAGIDEVPTGLEDGDEVTTSVTGTVNVNGADAEIPFEIEARLDGDVLYVLGRADFQWADFGMSAPRSNLFEVEDDVHVEVLLATER